MANGKQITAIFKETVSDWKDDNATRLAAALAFYTLLSIAPLVVIAVAVAGFVFGEDAARGQISTELGGVVGTQAGEAIQSIAKNADRPAAGIVSTIIGVAVLLFGASGVFGELQSSLNTIWEVEPKPGRGVKGAIRDRFFSFTMVLAVAFLLLVSLVLSAAIAAIGHFFQNTLPGGEALWTVVNIGLSLAMVTGIFGLIFKVVPDVEMRWRDVWIGAFVTALLFTLGKFLLGLYLSRSAVTSSYGAAGSVVALVVWVYYSSQIVFMGAEFTQVYARRFGSRIRPSEHAVSTAETPTDAPDDVRTRPPGQPIGSH